MNTSMGFKKDKKKDNTTNGIGRISKLEIAIKSPGGKGSLSRRYILLTIKTDRGGPQNYIQREKPRRRVDTRKK